MKFLINFAIAVVFLGALIVGGVAFWFLDSTQGHRNQKVIYELAPGTSFSRAAVDLENLGVIGDAFLFKVYGRILGAAKNIRVGEYELNKGMKANEILDVLTSGKSIERPLTVREGVNMFEVADLVEEAGIATREEFLAYVRSPHVVTKLLGEELPSLEGYLYADTYFYTKYSSLEGLVANMISNFKKAYETARKNARVKMKRHEAVILASMIEKETGVPFERSLIASVFHNRLEKGMKLQSDPTIIYGKWYETGQPLENIRKKDILAPNKFNTYTVKALPFGPIGNPGLEALKAVFHPKKSEYLYFVSRNDGTHVFSKTYAEHNNNVRKFQLDKSARQGKSWRDRLKN